MLCSISTNLDNNKIEAIKKLEKEIGKTVLAYSCHDTSASEIDESQLSKIKAAEKELDVVLVAVD